jgi:GT2 family glycosyltransferase
MAVLAIDNGSRDGSRELLEQALGPKRVLELGENRGVAGSLAAALELRAARDADYILVTHDDTVLDPDAVERLVEAATLAGVDHIGVVGPKIVDWENPRVLREVGRSTDRFARPSTPLQDGELDQGQFDRVLEVLFVSSAAMLISRACLERVGAPDDRLDSHHEDLDLCWRARLAGYRVGMTPLARARHMFATARGRRDGDGGPRARYDADRAALAAMIKNYRIRSLAVLLPLYAVLGFLKLMWLAISRRFGESGELITAWGWNLSHLPGTIRRRLRTQRSRTVPDRSIQRFMEPAGLRLPGWFDGASRLLIEQREIELGEGDEPARRRLRRRGVSLVRSHPVLVASVLGALLGAVAFRGLFGAGQLSGGALPAFPSRPETFFREFLSGVRTTGFGGTDAASPALAVLGALSAVLSSGSVALKVVLAGAPALGAVFLYRAVVRRTSNPFAAVAGAAAYALSALMLWAFSEGRLPLLVAIAVMPAIVDRFETAFGFVAPHARIRFTVGFAALLAFAGAFLPGILPAAAVLFLAQVLGGSKRGRGVLLTLGAFLGAALLLFPMVPGFLSGGGGALSSWIGRPDFGRLARFGVAPAPGSGVTAWFIPVAAVVGLALVRVEYRGSANRAAIAAVAGVFLSWASAAGWVPTAVSNAPAYVVMASASACAVIGFGVASVAGVRSEAFGLRQLGAGVLSIVLVVGIVAQGAITALGSWEIGGQERLPAAWAVMRSSARGAYRVLWLGADDGDPFPAPGGDPQGIVPAGARSLRYTVTGSSGETALDLGRGPSTAGNDAVRRAVDEMALGATRHEGALLAPFGILFVVSAENDLPAPVRGELDRQIDLNLVQESGLTIYRNARALPLAGELLGQEPGRIAPAASLADTERFPMPRVAPLDPVSGGWDGSGPGGTVFVSTEFTPSWRLTPEGAVPPRPPQRAFGWATSFDAPAGIIHVGYADQRSRTIELVGLALLWMAALWVTRKPARA